MVIAQKYGGLPTQIETFRGSTLSSRLLIREFKVLEDGKTWVPTETECTLFGIARLQNDPSEAFLQPVRKVSTIVDSNLSSWNIESDAKRFDFQFPEGSRIRDEIAGSIYVAGDPDPERHLTLLLANGQGFRKTEGVEGFFGRRVLQISALVLNGLFLSGILAIRFSRRRRLNPD